MNETLIKDLKNFQIKQYVVIHLIEHGRYSTRSKTN